METIPQAENLMRQASGLMGQAERLNLNHPQTMANCSRAFVLYARAVYLLLGMDFPEHLEDPFLAGQDGSQAVGAEAARLAKAPLPMLFPYAEDLPRVIVQAAFWSSFSGLAKTASQEADLRPGVFFGKAEASCAVAQARQCHTIVKSLIDLKK